MTVKKLTADDILGLTTSLLAPRYDDPRPVPDCHYEWWTIFCSDDPQVAVAAPRGHAKSTALTFAYSMALILFRESQHLLILGSNEELASSFVNDIRVELEENEGLIDTFGFQVWEKASETELIGRFRDGHKFRVICKGAMQRMRGMKWERKRPDHVIFDDLEDDEIVLNDQRREKFRRWFYGAARPIVKSGGKLRGAGTILHIDALLNRMMPPLKDIDTFDTGLKVYSKVQRGWTALLYRAHTPEYDQILWPEMYPEERLRQIRNDFAEMNMLDVYAQEYLNNPLDESQSKFRRQDFIPMTEVDFERRMHYYAAGDLAIGEKKTSAFTVFIVAGLDSDNMLNVVDVRRGKWDGPQIVEEMFSIHNRYSPEIFRVEEENIARAIGGFLFEQMEQRNTWINLNTERPVKDKDQRATAIATLMRAGRVRFDKNADWYPDFEDEVAMFPRAPWKDQVDAFSWLGDLIQNMVVAPTEDQMDEWAYEQEFEESFSDIGRNAITGY
jgi:predicted phage terminase large subunit-like protein